MKNSFKLRSLSLAALIGLASMGVAHAATIDEVDLSQQPLNTPTLEYLGQQGVIYTVKKDGVDTPIDVDGDGDANDPLKSSYKLTETIDSSLDNVITKYTYDETNSNLTEKYYQVSLNQTVYGTKETPTDIKYFNWSTDANGNKTLVTGHSVINPNDITYNVYKDLTLPESSARMTSFTSGEDIKMNFTAINNISSSSATYGGAIYTSSFSTIGEITGDFIGNYALSNSSYSQGGAIFNGGTIANITGDFIGNYTEANTSTSGGAISNYLGSISKITGDFIGNYALSNSSYAKGGAISNEYSSSVIGDITGNFIGNYVSGPASSTTPNQGGAIFNNGTITNITGDFIGNYVTASNSRVSVEGGAIFNWGTVANITGDFIGNHAKATEEYGWSNGGAIYNASSVAKIGDITGDFIGNYILSTESLQGGAIYNYQATIGIGNITGDFIGNYAVSTSSYAEGGAISNDFSSTIGDITGDFICNYVKGTSAYSGAIDNSISTIGNIKGNFIGNYVQASSVDAGIAQGGAIGNSGAVGEPGIIKGIAGDFIGNYAQGYSIVRGGAIANHSTIGNITGNFIENYTSVLSSSSSHSTGGGAVCNTDTIGDITGDFVRNYAKGSASVGGGAIHNYANIDDVVEINSIKGNFIENYVQGSSLAYGGAIYNYAQYTSSTSIIENITGNFIGNYANGTSAYGGVIYNSGSAAKIGDVTGDFIGNYAQSTEISQGGVIYNSGSAAKIGDIAGNFIGNYTQATEVSQGGAIYLHSSQNSSDVSYVGALFYMTITIENEDGSAYKSFYMVYDTSYNPLNEQQIENLVANGSISVLANLGSEVISKSEFDAMVEEEGKTEDQYFELIASEGFIQTDPNEIFAKYASPEAGVTITDVRDNISNLTLKNSNLMDNFAYATNGESRGGAIYAENSTVKIEANNGETTLISGNYTKNGEEIDDNAIYMNGGKLIFDVTNSSTIQLDDNINGENNYETYIIGDSASRFILNNKIKNSTTHLIDTNLYLLNDSNLDGNNLKLHSGMLSMINNQVGVSALNRLVVTGDTNVLVDVDLANKTMDRFTASEYGSHGGNLNVTGMNLLSDAVSDKTSILFAEKGLKDNVTYGGTELPDGKYQTTAYTPIYKYNVAYDNRDEAGYFVFTKGGKVGGSDSFNPAVLGGSTSATVGAIGTVNQTFNHAFNNVDTFMNIPYLERVSMKNRNKYALSITGDATDMGRFSPLYQPSDEEASVWVKPYATFETVGLKNGPKVHNNTYGTLVGFDTEMQSLKHGWDRVITGYIGYNGASQRYSGVDSTQNGGLIGGTVTMYKGNFFNATTVSVGANVAQNQTMYGKDDFAMLLSGVGNKTGYNFEFKEGKLILQPSMLMSYTFVNTFDYTNAAGVRIDNKPLHALQLAPGVKVIGNLKNGWQPYASVSMVWNLMGESDATANGVKLPEMSIKPYVQYGVGVQKRIKDHFTAYGQAMIQNGGRNGISLTGGFRWALGHDKCKYEEQKVEGVNDKSKTLSLGEGANSSKKIIKQMTPEQRMALGGGKYMNTSRTAKSGSLRQY